MVIKLVIKKKNKRKEIKEVTFVEREKRLRRAITETRTADGGGRHGGGGGGGGE